MILLFFFLFGFRCFCLLIKTIFRVGVAFTLPLFLSSQCSCSHQRSTRLRRINICLTAIYLCGNGIRSPTSLCGRAHRTCQPNRTSMHLVILPFFYFHSKNLLLVCFLKRKQPYTVCSVYCVLYTHVLVTLPKMQRSL